MPNPKLQSNVEWLNDYNGASGYREGSNTTIFASQRPVQAGPALDTLSGEYRYIGHKTTTQGRLVLDFMNVETGHVASRFFNVEIKSNRTGKSYRSGTGGQFTTRKGHRFRQFWLYVFGEPPCRWSRVHLELHRLKQITFIGTAEQRQTTNGIYWNLSELRVTR